MVRDSVRDYVREKLKEHGGSPVVQVALPRKIYMGLNTALVEAVTGEGTDCLYLTFHGRTEEVLALFDKYGVDTEMVEVTDVSGMSDGEILETVEAEKPKGSLFLDGLGFADRDVSELCRRVDRIRKEREIAVFLNVAPGEERDEFGESEVVEAGGSASDWS